MIVIFVVLIVIGLIFVSIYMNIPRYLKFDKKDTDKFLNSKGHNPKIKRVLYKMHGNSKEISLDYPELISSPINNNTDQLIVIDENRRFRNILFKIDYSKERYIEIKALVDKYKSKYFWKCKT